MRPTIPSSPEHAIRVASKIVSKSFGSCKIVNIVWLGIYFGVNEVAPQMWPSLIDALEKIRKDIKKKDLQGKAYINFSGGFAKATWPVTDKMIKSMTKAVNGVTELDALLILAAGNYGKPITAYPQLLGNTNPRVVVVGASKIDGSAWEDSDTASWVKVYADGGRTHVIGATGSDVWDGKWGPSYSSGTSFSKHLLSTRQHNEFS